MWEIWNYSKTNLVTDFFKGNNASEQLKARISHVKEIKRKVLDLKAIILSNAWYNWMHLRLQDFKYVAAYTSQVYKITSQLGLCGEKVTNADMLEKNLLNFSCI